MNSFVMFWAWLGERVAAEVEAAFSQFLCDAHRIARGGHGASWYRCQSGRCGMHGCRGCAPCPGPMDRDPDDVRCAACGFAYLPKRRLA